MALKPHSVEWYERLSNTQQGYFYPWRTRLGAWHGEDVFRTLVFEHLRPGLDVLEVACAHGDLALAMAPRCRSVLAYDVTARYIELARQAALERGIGNATFVQYDSSLDANGGRARLPAADGSADVIVCSKGPFHWMDDAPRVARPGAALLMLVPDMTPLAPWTELLPEMLRWEAPVDWARPAVEARLGAAGLRLHSWWSFDAPELFDDPRELYVWRAWGFAEGEVPPYAEVAPLLEQIFRQYAGPDGLEIRHRRHIWKAVV